MKYKEELREELQKWVDLFGKPAYIFTNGLTKKSMYFIPICDYDSVEINPDFDAYSYSQVVKDGKVICDLLDLIHKPILCGDPHIIIVPIEFNDPEVPEENIIEPVKKS